MTKNAILRNNYETIFPILFWLQSIVVLAVAISRGQALFIAPQNSNIIPDIDNPSSDQGIITNISPGYYESVQLLSGLAISNIITIAAAFASIQLITLLSFKSFRVVEYALTFIAGAFALIIASLGNYLILAGYIFTVLLAITIAKLFESRLIFAGTNLKIACHALVALPQLSFYALCILLSFMVWFIVWFIAAYGIISNRYAEVLTSTGQSFPMSQCIRYTYSKTFMMNNIQLYCDRPICQSCFCSGILVATNSCTSTTNLANMIPFTLLLFWTAFIAAGTLNCTVSSAIATWWNLNPYEINTLIVRKSFESTLYESFGAICFGSLLSAVIKTLWLVFYSIHCIFTQTKGSQDISSRWSPYAFALSCMDTILYSLDRAYNYFNRYALCFVAIHKHSFIQASLAIRDLFTRQGMTMMLNDTAIDIMLAFLQFSIMLLSFLATASYTYASKLSNQTAIFLFISSSLASFLITSILLKVVSAAVSTVFICFADNPEALRIAHPELFESLNLAWERLKISFPLQTAQAIEVKDKFGLDEDDEEQQIGHFDPDSQEEPLLNKYV